MPSEFEAKPLLHMVRKSGTMLSERGSCEHICVWSGNDLNPNLTVCKSAVCVCV